MHLLASVVALGLAAASLQAQGDTLGVLHHAPSDTASSGNLVTVTFDRPVAGRLDESVDASRIFRIEPIIAGRVSWRDPITIRFVPDAPLPPGAEFTVTIDTAFRAIDGSQLVRPYRFTFRVPGPRLLARSFGGTSFDAPAVLPLDGKLLLLYSAPIDLPALRRGVRLELPRCGSARGRPAMKVVRQRPLERDDPYSFTYAGGWDRDTTADRFRRVVELEPATPLPADCTGHLALPTTADDARFGREERYAVRTAPRFRLRALNCTRFGRCPLDNLVLTFTAPVTREQVARYVRLEPAVPLNLDDARFQSTQWTLKVRLTPRTTYTVVVDSAIRDVHGRTLDPPHRAKLVTGDYLPSVGYARGTISVPRSGARTLPVRHVNVRTLRVLSHHIRESRRARALSLPAYLMENALDSLADGTDTTIVTLRGAFNVEGTTELPLPESIVDDPQGLHVLTLEIERAIDPPKPLPGDVSRVIDLVVVQPSPFGRRYGPQSALIQLTDLAIHAKVGAGASTVLVTGLSDGRPRPGATVRQLDAEGRLLASAVADSSGVATLDPPLPLDAGSRLPIANDWPPRTGSIEAMVDDDRVITPLSVRGIGFRQANPLDASRLGGRTGDVPPVAAAIFAERGIYRPGDMLYLKGVVREGVLGALTTAPSRRVRLTLTHRPERWSQAVNAVILDTVLATNEFGTIVDSLRLRPGLALGDYEAALQVEGREPGTWRPVASESVRVAEYRVPEFLVELDADSTPRFGGDTVVVRTAARYLFGAPMGHAEVRWSAVLRESAPWELRIPGTRGWTVGEWDTWRRDDDDPRDPRRIGGALTLDALGRAEVRVPIAGLRPSRPGRVDVSVAVVDVNNQMITSAVRVPVHPAHVYVLARRPSRTWYWTAGEPAVAEIRTVRPDGTVLPDVDVVVSVVRREWRPTGYSGYWSDSTLRTDTVRTGSDPAPYSFLPAAGGFYELKLSAADGQGGTARTTLFGYALARGGRPWSESPYRLPLVVSTADVSVGDEVQVAFESPFDSALAWVTIERERVLERRLVVVRGGANTLTVPITEIHVPNVFVSVLLLRQGEGVARPDSAAERLQVGYTELRVSASPKRLAVTVTPDDREYGPGDTAVVAVQVRDAAGAGHRSEVTLWAVDQGILALTDFQTPDVVSGVYAPRGLGAGLWSTIPTILTRDPGLIVALAQADAFRLNAARVVNALSGGVYFEFAEAPGGDGASAALLRSRFRPTAFYVAAATTDEQGRAELTVELPDNLTTWRVMAVAIGADDRFGQADTTLLTTRPLVVRAALPRFVRAGDSLRAGAVVNARDGRSHAVTVRASSEGMSLAGEPRQEITLAAGKGAESTFDFVVPPRDRAPDSVVVRLHGTDGVNADAMESRLPVRPDFHPRAHTVMGMLRDEADVVLDLPADIDAARSRLTLRVGTSPLAPMLAAWERLRIYPYHCTEQIASVGRALIAVWRATRENDPDALGGDPQARLQQLADELARRQRADGGIPYWIDNGWSAPWLTAYAGIFLLDARAEGITVDDAVVHRTSEYLLNALKVAVDTGGMNREQRRRRRLALGDRVAVVDFLRRAGRPAVLAENELLRLSPRMTWEDRLRLAEVFGRRERQGDSARALVDAAWRAVTIAGRRVDLPDSAHADRAFPSRVAPAARLLTATLAVRPDHELLGGLVETVLQHGRAEGRWAWNTQDYASVVMAMSELTRNERASREVHVTAGGRTVLSQRAGATDSAAAVPLEGLLRRDGDGRVQLRMHLSATGDAGSSIYYAVQVDEVPSASPVTPDAQGIMVERWYERFDDGRPVTSVHAGDLVRVRLRVTVSSDRYFVAVEDPLPAGLEPVDLRLRTSASLQPFVTPASESARLAGARNRDGPRWQSWLYGSWDDGWWSPWDHKALHDDKVVYFARLLWPGSYTASYVARATTSGTFVRPPAHAEEMYNPALQGRSDGGRFGVDDRRR